MDKNNEIFNDLSEVIAKHALRAHTIAMVNPQEAAEVSTATLMATLKCLTLSATLITSNAPENAREESIDTVREIILESLNGPLSKEAILKLIKKREEIDNAAAI